MIEGVVEQHLVKRVEELGGLCLKFTPQGKNGYPDRLIILPAGSISFAELKRPANTPRALQFKRMRELQKMGCDVWWADTIGKVDVNIERLLAGVGQAEKFADKVPVFTIGD